MYAYIHIHAYAYIFIYIYIYIYMYIYLSVRMYVCMHTCMCVYMYVYKCTHTRHNGGKDVTTTWSLNDSLVEDQVASSSDVGNPDSALFTSRSALPVNVSSTRRCVYLMESSVLRI